MRRGRGTSLRKAETALLAEAIGIVRDGALTSDVKRLHMGDLRSMRRVTQHLRARRGEVELSR